MSESKYQCLKHIFDDVSCMKCIDATYNKYYKLLDFVKIISRDQDGCVGPSTKKEAKELLKEIEEL